MPLLSPRNTRVIGRALPESGRFVANKRATGTVSRTRPTTYRKSLSPHRSTADVPPPRKRVTRLRRRFRDRLPNGFGYEYRNCPRDDFRNKTNNASVRFVNNSNFKRSDGVFDFQRPYVETKSNFSATFRRSRSRRSRQTVFNRGATREQRTESQTAVNKTIIAKPSRMSTRNFRRGPKAKANFFTSSVEERYRFVMSTACVPPTTRMSVRYYRS